MRVTIPPFAVLLTKAAVSMMAKGSLSTASDVFLIFTIQLY